MPRGIVKWFDEALGYGFILLEDGHEELFVHYTSIDTLEQSLEKGQVIDCEVGVGKTHSKEALHVIPVELPP